MKRDAFSGFHPAVNFIFFLAAIGFGVVLQHPAYLLAGGVCAAAYTLVLCGRGALKRMAVLLPVWAAIALVNPLVNVSGATVLFSLGSRPYTLEALCYGAAVGGMFVGMLLWFDCYGRVLTTDRFMMLFGSAAPSLSLLLVMVLRLIPAMLRRARRITQARMCIGKVPGMGASLRDKLRSGGAILSTLTDWSLEGGILTADSMRARGYGVGKRTNYRQQSMQLRDWLLLSAMAALCVPVLTASLNGAAAAAYTPWLQIPAVTPAWAAYWGLLLIPVILEGKERLQWAVLRSKI